MMKQGKETKSHMRFLLYGIGLFLVTVFAFLIRMWDLHTNPPGFFCDEAAIGFNAFTLLTTGKDEYGIHFPLFFRSFGDYRLPIPIYANILSIALFGLTEFAVRFTAVFFGLISIVFTSLTAGIITNKRVALFTGFLMAILPWHIQMSRWGSEYMYFPALISIGLFFLVKSITRQAFFPVAAVFFGLAMYTYYPTLFVTPLFLLISAFLFVFFFKKSLQWKYVVLAVFSFFLVCIPLFQAFANGTLLTRWNSVNNTQMSISKKIIQSAQFYAENFSLDFLFFKGDSDMPGHFVTRHSVRGFGELYLFQLPFLLLGIFYILWKKKTIGNFLFLALLVVFPLGSAVTNDGPLATRSVIGILPLSFFSAFGMDILFQLARQLKPIILQSIFFGISIASIGLIVGGYLYNLYIVYPTYSADFWGWQYGPKDIISYFTQKQKQYDEEIMWPEFNAPEIFFKFYAPNDCKKCLLGTPAETINIHKKQLFAVAPSFFIDHPTFHMRIQKTLLYPDKSVAFYIGEIVQY